MTTATNILLLFLCMFSSSMVETETANETLSNSPESNITTPPQADEPTQFERNLVALSLGFFAVTGICAYAPICYVLIRHKRDHFTNPFYTLALGLAGGDLLHLVPVLLVSVPELILGDDSLSYGYEVFMGVFVSDAGYWVIAPLCVIICLNRYVALYASAKYQAIFSPVNVKLMVLCSYILGFGFPAFMFACSCVYLFDSYTFYWRNCASNCAATVMNVNLMLSTVLTIMVAVIYAVIFIRFRGFSAAAGSEQKASIKKKEKALLIQCFFINLFLCVYIAMFWYLALYMRNRHGNYIQYMAATFNSCVNPFLYAIFSSDIRQKLSLIGSNKVHTTKVGTMTNRMSVGVSRHG